MIPRLPALRRLQLCLALFMALPTFAAGVPRVAISDFTTDENEWESIKAVADFAPALQAELTKERDFEWVERAQLGLARKEIELSTALGQPDLPNAVRRARWTKADWLMTGHFTSKEGARELLVEVIDLAHADVLAERRVKLPTAAKEPLRAALAHLSAMAGGLREVLHAAEQRERAVAGLPIVAVLFFPDSEAFQRELQATLADPKLTGGPVRVLRFPRAGESLGEAELVLGGFAEDESGAWRGIADAYVWGSLVRRESGSIDGETITDAHTPKISLTVWDGRLSPIRFVEAGGPVARREFDASVAAQARRLGTSLAETVHARRPGALDESQREQVSLALLRSAEQLEQGRSHRESYLHEPEGRRHFFNVIQTLDAACFFNPENRAAQLRLVESRWNRRHELEARSRFSFQLGRSEAWGGFVERFGLPDHGPMINEQIAALLRTQPVDHEQIRALVLSSGPRGQTVANEFLSSARDLFIGARLGNAEDFGFPHGVPKGDTAQWVHDLALEVARRTVAVAGREDSPWAAGLAAVFDNRGQGFFYLRDARKRVEVLEKVWPHFTARMQDYVAPRSDLRKAIKWTFEELGRKDEEEKFFAALPPPPPTPPRPPPRATPEMRSDSRPERFSERQSGPSGRRPGEDPSGLFLMPAITALPPEVKPVIEDFEATKKAGLFRVQDLTLLGGRVWLIGEGLEQSEVEGTNRALAGTLRTASAQAARLFSLDPASGHIERVASTRQFTPVSLLAHDKRLWLALGRDGVATLDPDAGALQRFGPGDGLDVQSAYRLAVAGDRVFVTANMSDAFVWEPGQKRWNPWDTKFPDYSGPRYGGEIRRVCGLGSWLLLFQQPLAVCDVRSPGWTRYDSKLAGDNTGDRALVSCVTADARGFWLGGPAGLHFLDPNTGETVDRVRLPDAMQLGHSPSTAKAVEAFLTRRTVLRERRDHRLDAAPPLQLTCRLPGPVTALASDGDFLWVAANAPESPYHGSHVMLLHKPSGRWVAQFRTSNVTCLAIDGEHLWLGCRLSYGTGASCLLRLKKQTLYGIPEDRWMPDTVAEGEARGAFERLGLREQALWHFTAGDYAAAAGLLAKIGPPTTETLFLQGLCHDATGLNQPEKSRAFFSQIITAHPADSLAEEARKQLANAAGEAAR